jgi:hypothetical protein
MGAVKSAYQAWQDATHNGHVHPAIAQALDAFSGSAPPEPLSTHIYLLMRGNQVVDAYKHKATAEYDLWVCQMGDEKWRHIEGDDYAEYSIVPTAMHNHKID